MPLHLTDSFPRLSLVRVLCQHLAVGLVLGWGGPALGDWPMLKGNARHDGYVEQEVKPPFRLAWARHFLMERMGSSAEPAVADGRVFVTTHGGFVVGLQGGSGEVLWKFQAQGAFLHSPTAVGGVVVAASMDGRVYGLDAVSGHLRWQSVEFAGGFAAAPVVEGGRIFLGTRGGEFLALQVEDGRVMWRQDLKVPIRQTAAVADGRVFVMAEDLRLRGFTVSGELQWTSEPMPGQTARDYYPVVVKADGRWWVVVRTNPAQSMAQRLAADGHGLARQAGVDDSTPEKLAAWWKSGQSQGGPELWRREQEAVRQALARDRAARTLFIFDAGNGQERGVTPVLWAAGCQGVGIPPVATPGGDLIWVNRSAYGPWNLGVVPMVALQQWNISSNTWMPLPHGAGTQPPWGTFWGTADESRQFVLAGQTLLMVHQDTLSGFDLKKGELFRIQGERDTFGGLRSPAWAQNEWHGPARGGVAVDGRRLYWIAGSRLLCVEGGSEAAPGQDQVVELASVRGEVASAVPGPAVEDLQKRLEAAFSELLTTHWAPLRLEPGLAGREYYFGDNAQVIEAGAWAFPHLSEAMKKKVGRWLAEEWENYPPFTDATDLALEGGRRREYAKLPTESEPGGGGRARPHPFGNMAVIAFYGERCGETKQILRSWPRLRAAFQSFERTGWRLDAERGDPWANRYLASLLALADFADQSQDSETAGRARAWAEQTGEALQKWWQRAAAESVMQEWAGVAERDRFIQKGTAFSLALAPHRHQTALLHDLNPTVAERLRREVPDAVTQVWSWFETVYRTWPWQGEERQVHSGENFVDGPDLALDAFRAMVSIQGADGGQLARRVDIPSCRADLAYIIKLSMALDRSAK